MAGLETFGGDAGAGDAFSTPVFDAHAHCFPAPEAAVNNAEVKGPPPAGAAPRAPSSLLICSPRPHY